MFILNVSGDSYSTVLANLPSNTTYIISVATWNHIGVRKFSNSTNVVIPQAGMDGYLHFLILSYNYIGIHIQILWYP